MPGLLTKCESMHVEYCLHPEEIMLSQFQNGVPGSEHPYNLFL